MDSIQIKPVILFSISYLLSAEINTSLENKPAWGCGGCYGGRVLSTDLRIH